MINDLTDLNKQMTIRDLNSAVSSIGFVATFKELAEQCNRNADLAYAQVRFDAMIAWRELADLLGRAHGVASRANLKY